MYIVNKFGILHSIPDDLPIPTGARVATEAEVLAFEETGEQDTRKMAPKEAKPLKKEAPK